MKNVCVCVLCSSCCFVPNKFNNNVHLKLNDFCIALVVCVFFRSKMRSMRCIPLLSLQSLYDGNVKYKCVCVLVCLIMMVTNKMCVSFVLNSLLTVTISMGFLHIFFCCLISGLARLPSFKSLMPQKHQIIPEIFVLLHFPNFFWKKLKN